MVAVVTVAVAEAGREYENLEGVHVRTTCTRNANGRSSGVPLPCSVLKNGLWTYFTYITGSISLWVLLLYGFPNIVGYDVLPHDGLVLAAIR